MSKFVVEKNPKSPISEAYRILRTNIQFSSFEKEVSVIVVTSTGPQEGKSTTSGNLALSIAETGKRVLLVDCDLRKPTLHKNFRTSNITGVSDLLIESLDLEATVQKYNDCLYLLPSGTIPPNPAEMLSSTRMRKFLEDARTKFDYIILDTPPVIAVTDAQILSTMSDGVLLVVASGQAEIAAVARAKELLLKVNAKILGVVLNKVDVKSRKDYGYYYGDTNERGTKK